jgi:hypothetical protein
MNCFQWHNSISDFLDGELPEPQRTQADQHLDECADCKRHFQHYQMILTTLTDQPKYLLPADLRKEPLAALLPRIDTSKISLNQWERIPWYLRILLEATGIVVLVLLGIGLSPKIRTFYEKRVAISGNELKEGQGAGETLSEVMAESSEPNSAPKSMDKNQDQQLTTAANLPRNPASEPLAANADEISGEDEGGSTAPAGKSQLWRFTLKTVSPDELRPQVIKALQELGIPPKTRGMNGNQVPGGIEFDLFLPPETMPSLKQALEKIVPGGAATKDLPAGSEIFTWYKVKSRKRLPEGMAKVVIWLSQPN